MAIPQQSSVLVVDDDPEVRTVVAWQLEADGFAVRDAPDAASALEMVAEPGIDLIVLDLSLPDADGLDALRAIHRMRPLPIIILTGRGAEADRIRGLDLGADDYVVKPFSPRELSSRIRSVLRRSGADRHASVAYGPFEIDGHRRLVTHHGAVISLTPIEYKLLHFLATSPGQAFTRAELLHEVWRSQPDWQSERTVIQHVYRLRSKLGPSAGAALVTVPGGGYLFDPDRIR
jgi:two-component system phosphate regulon response regulator PhoB